jgi:hypothetical protein
VRRIVAGVLVLLAFLVISAGLARVLSANGAERSAIARLLDAQAQGDTAAMVARIDGCAREPACRASAGANAARLRSSGKVEIVRLDPSTNFSLGGATGTARVVWTTPSRTTVVQCVQVHRGGDVVSGLTIGLRRLSAPIDRQSSCTSGS